MSSDISIPRRVEARPAMLEACCNCLDRRGSPAPAGGRPSMARCGRCGGNLRRTLATDCPRMQAGRMHDAFGVCFPRFVGACPVIAWRVATISAIGDAGQIEATAA